MWRIIKKTFKPITTMLLILALFLAGFPPSVLLERIGQIIADRNIVDSLYHAMRDPNVIDKGLVNLLRPRVEKARAATFQIQTGSYIGSGASKSITGLGFSPQMIVLKSNTTTIAAVFKTTAMPVLNTAYLGSATVDSAAGFITLNSDGFTVASTANTANVRYTWTAFTGSDCTASGVFCIGSYQGTAAAKAITTGFSPNLVIVKPATAVAATWRSSAMGTNVGQYFMGTIQDTTGVLFTTLDATGFTVGATNSPTGVTNYYAAFKSVAGSVAVGTYTAAATPADNTNIAGVGFVPDFVFVKNAPTAVSAVYNVKESYGDSASYFSATANIPDMIQALQTDGFQIGLNATVNSANIAYFYAAFGGSAAHSASGTFSMATGSYTGTAAVQTISNLGFSPDLVIIKGNTTQAGAFRTRMMAGDITAYLDSATTNFAGGITALNPDSFTVGTSVVVNTNAVTYYWTAYGNAWNPDTNSGAADFTIGAYYGNGIDSRNITRLPFQPNMVAVKNYGTGAGVFRTSAHTGDLSSYFAATAEAANIIQTLNTDGFQVGTAANVNTAASVYHFFAFKSGTNFEVGAYSGTGVAKNVPVAFQPDNIWVKSIIATRGVSRPSSQAGDGALPFINIASITGAITAIIATGFSVGTAAETNTSGTNNYRYVAWKNPAANSAPTLSISQPDGVSDTVTVGDLYNITYTLSDTDDVVTAAFYYDTNNTGLDGTTISGACATAAEGTNATCSWDTTGMTPGSYYVYGTTTDGVNPQVSAYSSGTITINAAAVVSVTLDRENFPYGSMANNTASSTLSLWSGAGIIATNGGAIADFYIYGANSSGTGGGWILSNIDNSGNNYMHKFCDDTESVCTGPPTNYTALTTSPALLEANVAAAGTRAFQLQLTTPTAPTDFSAQSAVVTVQASAP
ncbi:MAG: hypothetical protein Q8N21_00425 [bacterium]|nr:hypothetical protein [bacterium]